jgi:hypothetical protein
MQADQSRLMKRVWQFGAHFIPKSILYDAFKSSVRGFNRLSIAQFFLELKKVVPSALFEEKKTVQGYADLPGRPMSIRFKSLRSCRAAWETDHGSIWQDMDEEDDDEDLVVYGPQWVVDEATDPTYTAGRYTDVSDLL